jgi:AraC-like DNA-binding protein
VQENELGFDLYHTTFESIIDDPICKGSTRSIVIREGITMLKAELTFFHDTEIEMKSTQPQVGFVFFLKGLSTAYINELNNKKADYSISLSPRTSLIYANASSGGPQHYPSSKPLQALYIHFSYPSFKELVGESLQDLPNELYHALANNEGSYRYATPMSKELLTLSYSLFDNPFKGKSGEFYTEAKVIELLAHQVDVLLKANDEQVTPISSLNNKEIEKIDFCYRELQEDLSQPPSVIELAKRSGLSVYRLKNGLRQRYGHSVSGLLTELRMLKARELLEKGKHNVSEVATEVGYSSLGTFSNAFSEKFGRRPSTYIK